MIYDYMFHTTDRHFSGIGIVDAEDVKRRRPDVEVRLIRVEAKS